MKKDKGQQSWGITGTNILPFGRIYASVTTNNLGQNLKVQKEALPAWVGTYPPVLQVSEPYAEPLLS